MKEMFEEALNTVSKLIFRKGELKPYDAQTVAYTPAQFSYQYVKFLPDEHLEKNVKVKRKSVLL